MQTWSQDSRLDILIATIVLHPECRHKAQVEIDSVIVGSDRLPSLVIEKDSQLWSRKHYARSFPHLKISKAIGNDGKEIVPNLKREVAVGVVCEYLTVPFD